jgi:hypothetical protein
MSAREVNAGMGGFSKKLRARKLWMFQRRPRSPGQSSSSFVVVLVLEDFGGRPSVTDADPRHGPSPRRVHPLGRTAHFEDEDDDENEDEASHHKQRVIASSNGLTVSTVSSPIFETRKLLPFIFP